MGGPDIPCDTGFYGGCPTAFNINNWFLSPASAVSSAA
jgi:hypothetical protein